jgi:hypothetical protein
MAHDSSRKTIVSLQTSHYFQPRGSSTDAARFPPAIACAGSSACVRVCQSPLMGLGEERRAVVGDVQTGQSVHRGLLVFWPAAGLAQHLLGVLMGCKRPGSRVRREHRCLEGVIDATLLSLDGR